MYNVVINTTDDFITTSHCNIHFNELLQYFVRNNKAMKKYRNTLSSVDKILIKTCENLKDFLPEGLLKIYS